jgi:hypothetical protein
VPPRYVPALAASLGTVRPSRPYATAGKMPGMGDDYARWPAWVQILIGVLVFVVAFLAAVIPDLLRE